MGRVMVMIMAMTINLFVKEALSARNGLHFYFNMYCTFQHHTTL
jgi:hypothetical protein